MGFVKDEVSANSNVNSDLLKLIHNKFSLAPLTKRDLRRILYNKLNEIKLAANIQNCEFAFKFPFLKRFVDENYKEDDRVKSLNDAIEKKLIPSLSESILNGGKKIELFS